MKTLSLLLTLCFCQPALAITIATGAPGVTYYQIAQDIKGIAEKEGLPVEVVQTNGSFDNINLLGSGKVDLSCFSWRPTESLYGECEGANERS